MAQYVDGYVLPLPKKNLAAYKKLATKASKLWLELGALEYCESVGEDLAPKGCPMNFTKLAKPKAGETVVFAWIVYKSKKHRDQVNKRVMSDPRVAAMCNPENTPFDFKRMAYGGFEVIVKR